LIPFLIEDRFRRCFISPQRTRRAERDVSRSLDGIPHFTMTL
jgi:hypothetical protein